MTPLQNLKVVNIVPPKAIVNGASYTVTAVDCRGFSFAQFLFILGATDIALTALKVQESDDDGSSDAYADVTGAVYGTSNDITGVASALPSATDDNKVFAVDLDLRGRKRYLKAVITVGSGSAGGFVTAIVQLAGAETSRDTASQRGLGNALRVP